jgi:hypothetical protein
MDNSRLTYTFSKSILSMKRYKNCSLLRHNTFGIDCQCDEFVIFESIDDAMSLAKEQRISVEDKCEYLLLGGGSNLLLTHDFKGKVITPSKRFDVEESLARDEANAIYLRCWAGTCFDDVVAYAVSHGYCGMENLSLIPGECGASAVQNIGAYGTEIKDMLYNIEAVDLSTGKVVSIWPVDCQYGYRQSRFKHEWKDRFIITHVTYKLSTKFTPCLNYGNLQKVLDEQRISESELTPQILRNIIIDIRRSKLPDPAVLGNAGSFFMNPMVDKNKLENLKKKFPNIKYFEVDVATLGAEVAAMTNRMGRKVYKIPAGWMIDHCGWKGKRVGNVGVYDKQALVLVNYGGASGQDVVNLMRAIQKDVFDTFGVSIIPEVNIK